MRFFWIVAFWGLLFCESRPLFSQEWTRLTWPLQENQGDQEVEIRGFVQKDPQGEWFLSDDPGLKSCCRHLSKNIGHHLSLPSEWSQQPGRALTLRGYLSNRQGTWHLSNISIVESDETWQVWLSVGAVAGVAFLCYKWKWMT